LRHGGLHGSTGSKGRDDCCVIRSDRNRAAIARTVRRGAASRGRISQARPHFGRPGEQRLQAIRKICILEFAGWRLTGTGRKTSVCHGATEHWFLLSRADAFARVTSKPIAAICTSPRRDIGRMSTRPKICWQIGWMVEKFKVADNGC
jgi:hypothetical protein